MNGAPDLYANAARVTATLYEIALTFTLNTFEEDKSEGPGGYSREEVVRVRMSPQHARALSILLDRQLRRYEAKFANIFLPNGLIEMLADEGEPADAQTGTGEANMENEE